MNYLNYLSLLILPVIFTGGIGNRPETNSTTLQAQKSPVYQVAKLKKIIKIDGNWDKAQWRKIKPVEIKNYMGKVSEFQPEVQSKMMYDDQNVYVIFRVKDKFVKSVTTEYNGPVSTDSCVEFFFAPDSSAPLHYFNLEVNAGGTPLIFYVLKNISDHEKLEPTMIKQIEIAHSLPEKVDPEIAEPVTWTIEYRIPLSILSQYCNVTKPGPGVKWKANFYKTGSKTSNPNYITWAPVEFSRPNFHLPQFFGTLAFQK